MRLLKVAITLGLYWQMTALQWPSLVQAQDTPVRKYAILVGVREYDRNQLKNLPFAENDVAELAVILSQSGFRRVELLTQTEGAKKSRSLPMAKTIREAISGILEDRQKNDVVLIAFAGHGVQFKGENENFFCPMDAVLTDRSTLISLTDVYEQLKLSNAGAKMLLVDACRNDPLAGHSRAAADVDLQGLASSKFAEPPEGVAAFFSCSAGQRAFEDESLQHGVFFHHVIKGLKGEAKNKKREEVTWDSLVAYVKSEVPDTVKDLFGNATRQIPERRGELHDEVAIVSFASKNAPPPIPSETPSPTPKPNVDPTSLRWPFTATEAKAAQEAWAKSMGKEVVEKNSLGMAFVLIPSGYFVMGSPDNEKGRGDDEDQVDVTITKPFWLGQTEVTQGQWKKIMGTAPWKDRPNVKEGPDYAANFVSWDDAQEFIKKLNQKEGLVYRLPTEAEWEWSCRAGTTSRWSFGESEKTLFKYAWFGGQVKGNSNASAKNEQYAHKVGLRQPNPFGLSDMHGNLMEWCEDVKSNKLPGGTDPVVTKGGNYRVLRGGSWRFGDSAIRSAKRSDLAHDDNRNDNLGFRVAR